MEWGPDSPLPMPSPPWESPVREVWAASPNETILHGPTLTYHFEKWGLSFCFLKFFIIPALREGHL